MLAAPLAGRVLEASDDSFVLARYLLVMGPETNRLIDAIHSASSRDPESLRELFETHGSELLG